MKIQSMSNRSFGALMLECKPMTREQKIIAKHVKKTILEDKSNIDILEKQYVDVYISPNDDKKSVDLKLLKAAGLNYNFVPRDDKGYLEINLHVPPQSFRDDIRAKERLEGNIFKRTKNFMARCMDAECEIEENRQNKIKQDFFEEASLHDLMTNRIQYPDIIPDAYSLYGNQAVMTK
ncbi:hypothetical protein IJS77_02150 [bacterium]|nr:hypothetical protein [bacterium]